MLFTFSIFTMLMASTAFATRYIVGVTNPLSDNIEFESVIRYFEIGELFKAYLMDYSSFPFHLYQDPNIVFVNEDQKVSLTEQHVFEIPKVLLKQMNPVWNLDRIDQSSGVLDNIYYYPYLAGINVSNFVLDTGIDINHPEFEGRAIWGTNTADKDNNASNYNPHGTHVAGIIGSKTYGVAKKTKLISVKVLDNSGTGAISSIIAGIEWVGSHLQEKNVINLSLGMNGVVESLNAAIRAITSKGVHVVVAAGNSALEACGTTPASEGSAIAVGSTNKGDTYSKWSNWGPCVAIYAPGANIVSTIPNKQTRSLSGTSMASPHVCGVISLILNYHGNFTPKQMKDYVMQKNTKNIITNLPARSNNNFLYSLTF